MESHWQDHRARLERYIARQIQDESLVDDLMQEVYFKAHTRQHTLKSKESVGGWLYRIAHNTIMDHFRQQKLWVTLPDGLEQPELDSSEQIYQELMVCLEPLMNELPEKYRVPLQMAELEGMSQKDVAEQLGLSLTAAKSRIQRARAKLRKGFTDCCGVEVGRRGITDYYPPGCKGDCGSECG